MRRTQYDHHALSRASRIGIAVTVSLLVLVGLVLFVFPSGCNDVGGVSSWERCITPMGTPAFSVEDWGWDSTLNVVPPIVAAVLVGFLVWAMLGRISTSGQQPQSPNETAQIN